MKKPKRPVSVPESSLATLLGGANKRSTSRSTVARVRYIHQQVRAGKYPNCRQLAEEFELSTRTIDRDMEAIRNLLNLPLEFCFVRNGYYYTRDVPSDLPRPKLSAADMVAFSMAFRALERFRGTDFAAIFEQALRTIMDEVEGEVPLEMTELDELLSFGPQSPKRKASPEIAGPVSEALLRQRELEVLYWNLDGQRHEPRCLQPLHLRAMEDVLYLFAIDPQREDGEVRRFVLSRMKKVKLTSRSFARPKEFAPDEEMRHSVGAYRGGKPETVRLGLSALATRVLDERPLHHTQKLVLTKRAAGRARKGGKSAPGAVQPEIPRDSPRYCRAAELTMKVAMTPELEQKILYWGLEVDVLEPKALRERVLETARGLLARAGR